MEDRLHCIFIETLPMPGSGCTSLGRYKTGASYNGRFGLSYKLYGLDSMNKNAYRRNIVLHGHDCVPDDSEQVLEICQSDGCPMVSPRFMQQLHTLLRSSYKPVLLWIYSSSTAIAINCAGNTISRRGT